LEIDDIIDAALDCCVREQPSFADAAARRLGTVTVEVAAGASRLWISARGGRLVADRRPSAATISVAASLPTILSLLDGKVALLDALKRGEVLVRGPVDALLRGDGAFESFLQGMLRARSSEVPLRQLRQLVGNETLTEVGHEHQA